MRRNAADEYYNLLVQGFRAGQLSLKQEVPPGFAQLADPYDPTASAPYQFAYGMLDLSYYKGELYLYWGVAPALLLFWPFVALTGHYLFQSQAVTIFCAIGFLTSVGLLCALWRRYFADVSVWLVAGRSESGLRAGGGVATVVAVWRHYAPGAGGPNVARAAASVADAGGGNRPDHAHRVGTDAVQRAAIR